ncbi:hypothetical protein AMECASPLE_024598 [Ameca splendens]|uniref:Uncharacterized protein n=1 Tax=Ameca splendens TaxID=208324 RepID=A0ABV0YFH7_9TELE
MKTFISSCDSGRHVGLFTLLSGLPFAEPCSAKTLCDPGPSVLATAEPNSCKTSCLLVTTSLKLPQPKTHSKKSGSTSKCASRFICPACPPSNFIHHLRKPARTARSPANLSLHDLPTPSRNLPTPLQDYGVLLSPRDIITINFFKPSLFPCAALESPDTKTNVTEQSDQPDSAAQLLRVLSQQGILLGQYNSCLQSLEQQHASTIAAVVEISRNIWTIQNLLST